jgi:ABC-type antimicrobial peptide transport system permease subunit
MIGRYVLKSLGRHKMRTAIMVLALMFAATMLVILNNTIATSRRQIVDLIARAVGEQDITITRVDTSQDRFIDVARVSALLEAADPQVRAIYPRFQTEVEVARGTTSGKASLIARDPVHDELGTITMLEGAYDLSGDQVVILRDTADAYNLHVGDPIGLSYVMPVPRDVGQEQQENLSVNRASRWFTVSGIALQAGLGGGTTNGVLADVDTVEEWLGIPGRAERLVIVLDPRVYNALDVEHSVFYVRRIAERMRAALGEDADAYDFALEKAESLDGSDMAFSMMQTLVMVYGFLSMGVVGLLVYSLINANVEDRRRDLAFMRILGARQRDLFALVLIEVLIVGAIGVGLGTLAGQSISTLVIDRVLGSLIANLIDSEGGGIGMPVMGQVSLTISPWSLFSTALVAGVVLLLSALAPAIKAARTKVRYAIDPGSADNLQIEDLAVLRERHYNWNITLAGFVLTVMWGLTFLGQNFLYAQSNESVLGAFLFGGMVLLILGVSLLFFTLTIPFERLALALFGLIAPRLAFFASRNVQRAKQRNTVIALMIVFSATLPTFLGTTAALTVANFDVSLRQSTGAPVECEVWGGMYYFGFFSREENAEYLRPDFIDRFTAVQSVGPAVGLTYPFQANAHNLVTLRQANLSVYGITRSPLGIIYPDLTNIPDGEAAFQRILSEPDAILLSAGFAEYMDVQVGDVVVLEGKGLDHQVQMHVAGLIERMAGFRQIGRDEQYIRWGGSPAFVSMDTFLRLSTDPNQEQICIDGVCSAAERDKPVIQRIWAGMDPAADSQRVTKDLREALSDRNDVGITITEEEVRVSRQGFQTMRVVLLVLTVLSLITSVLGVFSVVFVTVHTRRMEIGMLKAIGITGWQLVGSFAIESMTMTISATLAGATAGTGLGYMFYASNNMMQNVPTIPAFDTLTVSFVLVMVIIASLVSAVIASRSIVRQRVTQIMRGV